LAHVPGTQIGTRFSICHKSGPHKVSTIRWLADYPLHTRQSCSHASKQKVNKTIFRVLYKSPKINSLYNKRLLNVAIQMQTQREKILIKFQIIIPLTFVCKQRIEIRLQMSSNQW